MIRFSRVLVCLFAFGSAAAVFAHGTQSHQDEAEQNEQHATAVEHEAVEEPGANEPAMHGHDEHTDNSGAGITFSGIVNDLTWSEFPTLHPMVVHVPVTLIPMAFVLALVGLFVGQRTLLWLAMAFAAIGLAGGLIAAYPTHPHTHGLPAAAQATLEKHDFFAYTTLWLTLLSVPVAATCIWKPARWSRIALALTLLLASLSVALTGHYGGTLAYVHGIGSQGRFLSGH